MTTETSVGRKQRFEEVPVSRAHEAQDLPVRKDLLSLRTPDGLYVDAALYRPLQGTPTTGLVFIHPLVSFLHHFALPHLAARGYAALAVNSRYTGNESLIVVENVLLDLAGGIQHLREIGCEKVVLVGNSGGGGIVSLYQSQVEHPTITATPAGDPPDLTAFSLPRGDAMILLNAHRGRAQVFTSWLDPSVIDERDPFTTDPELDMYNPRNGPPYSQEWLGRYREAQIARNRRITLWVQAQLERLSRLGTPAQDLHFFVYRTAADPRFLDLSLDPSDRRPGTYWGDARSANYMLAGLGRVTSLRSWLSHWGYDTSNASATEHLKRVSLPILVVQATADQGVFLSDAQALYEAAASDDKRFVRVEDATHFFDTPPGSLDRCLDLISGWLGERGF